MIFREGTNIKGLVYFIIIILIVLLVVAWNIAQQNNTNFSPAVVPNYQVKLIYQDTSYSLTRLDNNLKVEKDGTITILDAPISSNISDLAAANWLLFDPYILINYFAQNSNRLQGVSVNEYQLISDRQIIKLVMNSDNWPQELTVSTLNNQLETKITFEYSAIKSITSDQFYDN
ncbi:MAG: hypothetical protein COX77_04000 [Candidatus Komeilibacteria bacterium CG_4_10_14_0_2_um_filter_37_10]|uniref:Uncharacterized protein n=1 Tax=Candidatus Komeilibacteria bacterium CG_4_10_14_0_2_um_filter_37_10 TaxID=1974470 RepID=A0A2M7VDW0_9BACT|nr:MAG: hypothetical protein COX77_04000 [Candidatus Komeilibacteria bacterium CG_4_10_14_0_2_um_filter_37_10]PJA93768.1 MAG: hypothetical protein CO133_00980 [Candidatus Komeilibacteria bacterium CG_4_9_14_3_um_filter_37_5]